MTDEEAREQEDRREHEDPVAEGVQPRERHVAAPEHEWDQVVAEAREHRRVEQEDHRGAVHREELVVRVGIEHARVGLSELDSHHEREQPGDEEEHERGVDVAKPDALVVDAVEEARDAGRVFPPFLELFVELGLRLLVQGHATYLQVFEVRRDVGDVAFGERMERRHEHTRLDVGRVSDPAFEVLGRVLDRAGAERRAGTDVVQVRADRAFRVGAGHRVAARARFALERDPTVRDRVGCGLARCALLPGDPATEVAG